MADILVEDKILNLAQGSSIQSQAYQLNRLKLDYLNEQKQKMQTQLIQLKLNNKILRKINQEILKNYQFQSKDLLKRNQQLEISYDKICKDNKKLSAKIFIAQQVKIDQEKDNYQIIQNYQNKILELRRLVQAKQSYVQVLQHCQNSDVAPYAQSIYLTANANNLYFYQKIQQMRQHIDQLSKQNNKLKNQNEQLKSQSTKMIQKIKKMQGLAICHTSYLQYKNLINEHQCKSLPKVQNQIKSNTSFINNKGQTNKSIKNCKTNGVSTTITGNKGRFKQINIQQISTQYLKQCTQFMTVGKIISKKCNENQKLKSNIRDLIHKYQEIKTQNNQFKDSIILSEKKRKIVIHKMNFYLSAAKNLINYLLMRKIRKIDKQHQIGEDNDCQIMRNFKKSLKEVQKNKKYQRISKQQWLQISKQLQITNPPRKQKTHLKRSLSSVLDYIRTQPLVLQKLSNQSNTLQNSLQQISNISIIFNDTEEIGKGPILGGSTSKVNIKNSFKISKQDVFQNVLQNL